MNHRPSFAWPAALVVLTTACDGVLLDLGSEAAAPPAASVEAEAGALDGTLDPWAARPGEVARVPVPRECHTLLGGTSATDLWCHGNPGTNGATADTVQHWNGERWSAVTIPAPTSNGLVTRELSSPSSRGKLWVVTNYGMARLDAAGPAEDFSSSLKVRSAVAQKGDRAVVLAGTPTSDGSPVYELEESGVSRTFVAKDLVPVNGGARSLRFAPDGRLWAIGRIAGRIAWKDGDTWTVSAKPLDVPAVNVLVGTDFWALTGGLAGHASGGSYCPPWCHPNQEPLNDATTQTWNLHHMVGAGEGPRTYEKLPVPPSVPRDGTVAYEGWALMRTSTQKLALLACVTERLPTGGTTEKRAVLDVWDGHAFVDTRRLDEAVMCDTADPRELADGTWALPATGRHLPGSAWIVLQP